MQRDFENTTDATIAVKEVGLVINEAGGNTKYLIVRAPVTDGVNNYQIVNPGEILRLKVFHVTPIYDVPGIIDDVYIGPDDRIDQ